MRSPLPLLIGLLCSLSTAPTGASTNVSVQGRLLGSSAGLELALIATSGETYSATPDASGQFSVAVPAENLAGATLQIFRDGHYLGPFVLRWKRDRVSTELSGRLSNRRKAIVNLGPLAIAADGSFARPNARLPAKLALNPSVAADRATHRPLGAGSLGLVNSPVTAAAGSAKLAANDRVSTAEYPLAEAAPVQSNGNGQDSVRPEEELGADQDGDGIPNIVDVDDDGDNVLDAYDVSSARTSARRQPFTTLYLDFPHTLNANVPAGLSQAQIDAVIGGENQFALIVFLSLAPDDQSTQGHVICPDSLAYCRRGDGTAVYTGLSESNPALRNQRWVDYTPDGSGYPNLESINQNGRRALIAGVQPRVGTDRFRPGDGFRMQLADATGTVTQSTLAVLPPYFISVPALHSFDTGAGPQTVDYSTPGQANMTLTSTGTLTVEFWRPQRLPIGRETGFQDMGHLHYGLLIQPQSGGQEFSCGGYYGNLSATLTEDGSLGAGGSPYAQQGATLWPLTDSADDHAADPAALLSFTVDLRRCLERVHQPAGTYRAALTAAGEPLTGGSNRAAQSFTLTVPEVSP